MKIDFEDLIKIFVVNLVDLEPLDIIIFLGLSQNVRDKIIFSCIL